MGRRRALIEMLLAIGAVDLQGGRDGVEQALAVATRRELHVSLTVRIRCMHRSPANRDSTARCRNLRHER